MREVRIECLKTSWSVAQSENAGQEQRENDPRNQIVLHMVDTFRSCLALAAWMGAALWENDMELRASKAPGGQKSAKNQGHSDWGVNDGRQDSQGMWLRN